MAYNYNPLTYTPYSPTAQTTYPQFQHREDGYYPDYIDRMKYDADKSQFELGGVQSDLGAFQDYTGQQLQGLMGNINLLGANPLVTGEAFESVPQYTPFGQTRQDYTSGGDRYWATRMVDDMHGGMQSQQYETNTPTVFDQKGYLDARFNNINSYLNNLGSFLGGMSNDPSFAVRQGEIQRGLNQAAMPQVSSMGNYGGTPTAGGLSGFAQTAPGGWGGRQVSGGWGSHPVVGGLLG